MKLTTYLLHGGMLKYTNELNSSFFREFAKDFQDGDTGMMMLIPGVRGEGDVARFHLSGGLPDPQKN